MKKIKKMKRRKGLSLIEVVLVVAIIGILATIVIPRFTGVADEATNKADLASARTIASAVAIAITESDEIDDIDGDDINRYLSNIEVEVSDNVNSSDEGWHVVFGEDADDDFEIYKDDTMLFPTEEENGD